MTDRLVTIAEFTDSIEASLAKQLLEDNGIECFLAEQNAANVYTIPTIAAAELQVRENQAQQALKILESNEQQES
jgi:hypothetical protein